MLHIFQTFPKFCLSRITLFCGNFWKIQILVAEGFKLSACLLYDFPLLKAELEKAKITLPSNTLCADSYVGIKEIFKMREWRNKQQNACISRPKKNLNFNRIGSPRSYSLINLHKHLLGVYPSQSHGAEADCLTLLRTTSVLGREWLDWVNDNSCLFSGCERMWSLKCC